MNTIAQEKQIKKVLVVVAGAAGEIGTEYIKRNIIEEHQTIAVLRNTGIDIKSDNLESIICHLDDAQDITKKFRHVDLSRYSHIIYLHTIGVDKFNPRNYPNVVKMETIDPDVYDTNVNSFKYLLRYLVSRVKNLNEAGGTTQLKVVALTGTSDKYAPFVIEDFCEAKFIIREYMRSYISRFPEWFSSLCINVTSTITKSAIAVRPFASTKYWLTPAEVVEKSYESFISFPGGYQELDLMKYSPDYIEGYYEDEKMLYEKWSAETGITG